MSRSPSSCRSRRRPPASTACDGSAAAALATDGSAVEVPLIRDDMAIVLIGTARQRGIDGDLDGESYVDSTLLLRGKARP